MTFRATDRGYSLPPQDDETISLEEFKQKFHKKQHKDLTVLAEKSTDFEQVCQSLMLNI